MNAVAPRSAAALTPSPDLGNLANSARARSPQAAQQAGRDFEALFLSMLLKEMRSTLEPGGLFGEDKSDIQGGLFDFFLGQSLAQTGGIGIARFLQQQSSLTKTAP